MTRLAVFDCDGTLVDGQAEVCAAMEAAFVSCGLPPPPHHAVRRIVGLSLPQAMARLLPGADDDTVQALDTAYRDAFRARRASGALTEPLYAGIADLLARLKGSGWELAVATGKSDRGLSHCLAVHGIGGLFASLQTADRHPSKPHPAMLLAAISDCGAAPGEAVMIGDTAYDIAMARAADVRAIGVAWGYHETAELFAAGAEAVARDPAHLAELLG